jgi:tRNA A37 threonylcarbamoyladenosine dehydratase
MEWLKKTQLLLGDEKLDKLKNADVLVVGLGGVGGAAAEMLCRAGIGNMTIADGDVVEETNRNRQIPALMSTTGKPKAEVMAERLRDINPEINLTVVNEFIRDRKTTELIKSSSFNYVVDAIDTLSPKVYLIYECLQEGLKIVSSMGAGGKMDPSHIEIADISESYNCKLAKVIRKRLSKLGVKAGIKVVFSSEKIDESAVKEEEGQNKKSTVGTISYMPSVFGCFVASVVIRELIDN